MRRVNHFYPKLTYLSILRQSCHGKHKYVITRPYYIADVDDDETYVVANGKKFPLRTSTTGCKFFIDDNYVVMASNCLIKEIIDK